LTVKDAISEAAARLEEAGVDAPGLTAELIMAHVLGTGRAGVLARLREELAADDADEFSALVGRRATRVPLQHITGTVEFCGLMLNVTPDTLIPRPETELLVVEALSLIKDVPGPVVADIGTGSGCIAIALAVLRPDIRVYAVDPSAGALSVAIENARSHGVSDRVVTLQGSLFGPLEVPGLRGGLDLVVSNPPYIPVRELTGLQPEVLREPLGALDGGPDGLDVVRAILRDAPGYMKPGAGLLVEIGAGQAGAVKDLVDASASLGFISFVPDFAGIERVLVARREG
jgi:release factor glutamine methyltransferase